MRTFLDSTCPRCGVRFSTEGLSVREARVIAAMHVCVDGVRTEGGDLVERVVPGPGERTKLPEEQGR
jgi:hypothetical protein